MFFIGYRWSLFGIEVEKCINKCLVAEFKLCKLFFSSGIFQISGFPFLEYHKIKNPTLCKQGNTTSYAYWKSVGPSCLLMTSSISFPTLSTFIHLNSQAFGQPLRSQHMYKTRSPTLKRFKWYIVDLKTMENTTKTKVIKTYQNHILDVGMFPCPLTLSDGGKRLRLASSWSLLLGPYTWSKVHKSPCVGGDDPPTIRNTRILHPGSTSRIKKHELAAPWSMRVFLHCAFLWRQCQLLVQLSNVSDSKQTKTNPSPLNREAGKDCWTIWNFLGWIQFQVLQNLAVTQPL